ncbi:hypothetical protein [Microscilla marina]|uniref:Membrane protein, putative n=1 Tax=Microscilla marina ATCC 23134 TaxID=313606 RepID=A1ZJE6_MICM2|nr:hypothetical protein [Microscilla marina]EAY29682.1 membrane protein, putative [Microscilla marina ATCC 23134]
MALIGQPRVTLNLRLVIFVLGSAIGYIWVSYFTHRVWFYQFIALYAGLFGVYGWFVHWVLKPGNVVSVRQIQWLGVLLRLIPLWMIPNLSDDFFRFYWDGKLLVNGYNPYLLLPKDFILTPEASTLGFTQVLYEAMNSPTHYTIYPPFNQALFATAPWLFPHSLLGGAVVMRCWIILGEIGLLWLLPKLLQMLGKPPKAMAWYVFNPYIVLELTANLHFEGVMIFMLLLAIYWLVKGGYLHTTSHPPKDRQAQPIYFILSVVAFTLAVNTKLIPLIFLPALFWFLGFKRSLLYYSLVGLLTALLFMFFITPDFIAKFQDSFNLYFQKFEFNASVYYVLRWIGYQTHGYNRIAFFGIVLSIIASLGALAMALYPVRKVVVHQLLHKMLFILTFYYLMATIVHPWYISVIVGLAVFTPYRFPMVWSAMLGLTYYAYSTTPYQENLWLVAVEYAVVLGWLGMELVRHWPARRSLHKL